MISRSSKWYLPSLASHSTRNLHFAKDDIEFESYSESESGKIFQLLNFFHSNRFVFQHWKLLYIDTSMDVLFLEVETLEDWRLILLGSNFLFFRGKCNPTPAYTTVMHLDVRKVWMTAQLSERWSVNEMVFQKVYDSVGLTAVG